MIAVVNVNATEPAANTNNGRRLVAKASNRKASLSVNSAMKMAAAIVRRAATLKAVIPYIAPVLKPSRNVSQ